MKDLYIFKDYKVETSVQFLDYYDKSTFQYFFFENKNEDLEELVSIYIKSQIVTNIKGKQSNSKLNICVSKKAKDVKALKAISNSTRISHNAQYSKAITFAYIENTRVNPNFSIIYIDQQSKDAKKSHSSRKIKLSIKAQEIMI